MRWMRPPMRSPTSMASGRSTTSSCRLFSLSCSTPEFCAGSERSITASRVNTAVDSRKGTRTTIRLMNAVISRWAACFRRRRTRMMNLLRALLLRALVGLDALHQVQEADLRGFEAVHDLARLRLQEGVDQ